jgi:hypothetical protein
MLLSPHPHLHRRHTRPHPHRHHYFPGQTSRVKSPAMFAGWT